MKKILVLLIVLVGMFTQNVLSQNRNIVTLTGVVVDADTVLTVPYASIALKNTFTGTISDNSGYFSIQVHTGDTLEFSVVGYKTASFVVPQNLKDKEYSLLQLLKKKVVLLKEVEVRAWPKAEDFVNAFHELKLEKNEMDKIIEAKKALATVLKKQNDKDKFYDDQIRYSKLYSTTGIVPPNNFLNPIKWRNFITDWRDGKFKKE